ncbi:unnamed protein product [Dibothriocephalus latus]|uniref:Uncharacterized protein n=1 Tax=Dibothriocephalus latus TaxID=60516 RepID=A0A3P7NPW5_DIBLA|nr:unnamed protein product [Dibothriocephalus latus]
MSPNCVLLWLQRRRFPLIPFCFLLLLLNALPSQTTTMKRTWSNELEKGTLQEEEDVLHVDDDPEDKEVEEPGLAPGPLGPANWKKRLAELLKRVPFIPPPVIIVPIRVRDWPYDGIFY